jgi:hypothetical protein
MKKLALLVLVLPLPAFASDITGQRMQQATEARTFCTTRNQGPESRSYMECINTYLQSRYGWRVRVQRDGSFVVNPSAAEFANNNPFPYRAQP